MNFSLTVLLHVGIFAAQAFLGLLLRSDHVPNTAVSAHESMPFALTTAPVQLHTENGFDTSDGGVMVHGLLPGQLYYDPGEAYDLATKAELAHFVFTNTTTKPYLGSWTWLTMYNGEFNAHW